MDEIDKTYIALKKPTYEQLCQQLGEQGIMTFDMYEEYLRVHGYGWTYEEFLAERRARIINGFGL